jgi:hypothetical protein
MSIDRWALEVYHDSDFLYQLTEDRNYAKSPAGLHSN